MTSQCEAALTGFYQIQNKIIAKAQAASSMVRNGASLMSRPRISIYGNDGAECLW